MSNLSTLSKDKSQTVEQIVQAQPKRLAPHGALTPQQTSFAWSFNLALS